MKGIIELISLNYIPFISVPFLEDESVFLNVNIKISNFDIFCPFSLIYLRKWDYSQIEPLKRIKHAYIRN